MIHKRAYFRGLCKIAVAQLKTTYGAQVGRGTRTNTLPTTDVVIKDKALTYGDLGFQNTGEHRINWANLDKRKAAATAQGKQYVPSFIEFITDKTISGQHYIPRDSINRMSHEMARIRGGQTPLSKRNVDHSDMLKYLNEAYKHDRDKYYEGNDNYLDSAIAAYQTYLQDPKDPSKAIVYKEQGDYQPSESGTLPTPNRIQVPTTPAADKQGTPPLISHAQQTKVFDSDYAKRLFTAFNMLGHDAKLLKAYKAGRPLYVSGLMPRFVSARFAEAGYTASNPQDTYNLQSAYRKDLYALGKDLGKDQRWIQQNMGTLSDLYSKYNQNRSN